MTTGTNGNAVQNNYLLVYLTFPDKPCAEKIMEQLVRERLVAGASLIDQALSLYWWQGQTRKEGETLCFCQTTAAVFPRLQQRILDLHPYQVPCIVALPILGGHAEYLQWIDAETAASCI